MLLLDSEGEEDVPQQVPVNSTVSSYNLSNQEQELTKDVPIDKLYYAAQEKANG